LPYDLAIKGKENTHILDRKSPNFLIELQV